MVSSDEIRRRLESKRRGTDPYAEKPPEQATVNCPECNTSNLANAKFCVSCGSPLVTEEIEPAPTETHKMEDYKVCPSCNQKNKANAKFCIVCGHKFEGPDIVNQSEEIEEGTVKTSVTETEEETPIPTEDEIEQSVTKEETPEIVPDEPSEEVPKPTVVPEIKVPEHLRSEDSQSEANVPAQEIGEPAEVEEVPVETESAEAQQTTEANDLAVEDVDPMEKIKKAKELLDIGAITQEDFDNIKNKYLKQI